MKMAVFFTPFGQGLGIAWKIGLIVPILKLFVILLYFNQNSKLLNWVVIQN